MPKRKTAGELSLKAASDKTKYDPLEIGHALTDDILEQLQLCALRHKEIFDEDEYFLTLNIAYDPLIKGIRRHKYAAWLYMPKPRPQQSCFLYNKHTGKIKRLWSLPDARVMSVVSQMSYVDKKWQNTKSWCDAFYHGWKVDEKNQQAINHTPHYFFEFIRHQHGLKHLSEGEYLEVNREKLIQSGCKQVESTPTDPFDFSKVSVNEIIDTKTAVLG